MATTEVAEWTQTALSTTWTRRRGPQGGYWGAEATLEFGRAFMDRSGRWRGARVSIASDIDERRTTRATLPSLRTSKATAHASCRPVEDFGAQVDPRSRDACDVRAPPGPCRRHHRPVRPGHRRGAEGASRLSCFSSTSSPEISVPVLPTQRSATSSETALKSSRNFARRRDKRS